MLNYIMTKFVLAINNLHVLVEKWPISVAILVTFRPYCLFWTFKWYCCGRWGGGFCHLLYKAILKVYTDARLEWVDFFSFICDRVRSRKFSTSVYQWVGIFKLWYISMGHFSTSTCRLFIAKTNFVII
jgi:hypothetical protein